MKIAQNPEPEQIAELMKGPADRDSVEEPAAVLVQGRRMRAIPSSQADRVLAFERYAIQVLVDIAEESAAYHHDIHIVVVVRPIGQRGVHILAIDLFERDE